jgi:hypothetical protein
MKNAVTTKKHLSALLKSLEDKHKGIDSDIELFKAKIDTKISMQYANEIICSLVIVQENISMQITLIRRLLAS